MDLKTLDRKLRDHFVASLYSWDLKQGETYLPENAIFRYQHDPLFHNRVESLRAGAMDIISDLIDKEQQT